MVLVSGGALLSAAGCNSGPPNCGLNQRYEPGFRSCIPLCGTREAPINASCFDQDSGTVRESGVELADGGDGAADASDASDAAMDTADVVGADASDAGGCGAGREMAGGACDVKVPRAIAPLSTARVSSRTPRLKWVLPEGVTGAHVEVCADRLCARLLAEGDATSEWAVPTELPTGVVFWRVRGMVGAARSARTSPTWWMAVPARSAAGGVQTSWGSVPDVNGDGLGDLVAAQWLFDRCPSMPCPTENVGVYLSGARGISTATPSQLIDATVADSLVGFGLSATDVNGDGTADLWITEPLTGGTSLPGRGRAHLYLGAGTGVLTRQFTAEGAGAEDILGWSSAALGDVNGDGYGDVGVGAMGAEPGGLTRAGEVRVYFGSTSGLSEARSQRISRTESRRWFSFSMAAVGDVNGDGYADMLVSDSGSQLAMVPSPSRAYLYLGGAAGFNAVPAREWTDGFSDTTYGAGAGAGDFNNDGYADIWINNYALKGEDTGTSVVDVYPGSATGPAAMRSLRLTAASMEIFEMGRNTGATADVDRDGYDDLIARSGQGSSRLASMRLYRGSMSGLATTYSSPVAALGSPFTNSANMLAPIGDINADGIGDWAAVYQVTEPGGQRLITLNGSATGINAAVSWSSIAPALMGWANVLYGR